MTLLIPPFQNLPPAGHEQVLAYRPACSQLQSQRIGKNVQWFIFLPTGENYVLATRSPEPVKKAHAALDSSGLCKVNGENVPIVPPNQALASERQTVENLPRSRQPSSSSILPWLALAAIALSASVIFYFRRPQDPDRQRFVGDES